MTVAVIDYGSGNLRSAAKALERAAADVRPGLRVAVTDNHRAVAEASHIVLPGVGAFGDCRQGLDAVPGMVAALAKAVIEKGRPMLGICVGMQLLAARGLEHGVHEGLGWIPGEVTAIDPGPARLPVPHMGWNNLVGLRGSHPVLRGIDEGTHMYFVHSYRFVPKDAATLLAEVHYGARLAAVVGRDNIVGTQFHPEKSQAAGLKLLRNFLDWRP